MMEARLRTVKQASLAVVSVLALQVAMVFLFLPSESGAIENRLECQSAESSNKWAIIGASYAKDWPIESIAGHETVNRGIGGDQSFEMHARFQADVLDSSPEAVLIWGFINDLFGSPPEKMEETKSRIKRSYTEMIEKAQGEGIYVVVATEVTLREPQGVRNWLAGIVGSLRGKESYQAMINRHVMEINSWLEEFAASRDIPVLDFQRVLSDPDGWRKHEYATEDGSHLTSAAYNELSRYTTDRIQKLCGTD